MYCVHEANDCQGRAGHTNLEKVWHLVLCAFKMKLCVNETNFKTATKHSFGMKVIITITRFTENQKENM